MFRLSHKFVWSRKDCAYGGLGHRITKYETLPARDGKPVPYN